MSTITTTSSHPLPAQSPPASRALIGYAVRCAICECACIVLGIPLIFVVPRFREIFKHFKTNLPALTEWLLSLSDFVANQYGWIPLLLLPFLLPLPILALDLTCEANTARVLRRIYTALLIFVFVAFILTLILGIGLPHIKLIQSVSGEEAGGR